MVSYMCEIELSVFPLKHYSKIKHATNGRPDDRVAAASKTITSDRVRLLCLFVVLDVNDSRLELPGRYLAVKQDIELTI